MNIVGLIIWLVVGGIVGWLASLIMKTDAQQGWVLNVVVGMVGALLAGFLAPYIGFGSSNVASGDISIPSILLSLAGAVLLLFIVKLFRRA